MGSPVRHRRLKLDGFEIFYREAGAEDAPATLLPHRYPCSCYEFGNFMPRLADRWRLLAPDFPGCGYSDTPENFAYTFDGYAEFLDHFADRMGFERFTIYLHDFGSQIGLRLALRRPEIVALIIQNGDIYEDALGPKYAPLQAYFRDPTPEGRAKLGEFVSEEAFRDEFLNDVRPELAELIPPDLWNLHWPLMTPRRREVAVDVIAGLKENLAWFPRYQAYLREPKPPTLIIGAPRRLYASGLGPAPICGTFLTPSCTCWMVATGCLKPFDEVVALTRTFLSRVYCTSHAPGI